MEIIHRCFLTILNLARRHTMSYTISGETVILNLESKHLESLLQKGDAISIPYNGHHNIVISCFKKLANNIYDDKYRKPSVVYNDHNGEFKVMIHEDDVPQSSMRWLEISLPKSSKKITTLKITCPLYYSHKATKK